MTTVTKKNVDFIGVGVPKAGTTWLAAMLGAHPEISVPEKKELDFFNDTFSFYQDNYVRDITYKNGIESYLQLFSDLPEDTLWGEYSVYYLYDEQAIVRIKESFPDCKLIVMLRHPVDRLYSHYLFAKSEYTSWPVFADIIDQHPDFVAQGFYRDYISMLHRHFPKEQVYVGIYADLINRPAELVKDIYNFLGVDSSFVPPNLKKRIHTTSGRLAWAPQLYLRLRNAFLTTPLGQALKTCKPLHIVDYYAKNILYTFGARKKAYTPMDPQTRARLLKIYESHIDYVESYLGRKLAHWRK